MLRDQVVSQELRWCHRIEQVITRGVAEQAFRCADPWAAAVRILAVVDGASAYINTSADQRMKPSSTSPAPSRKRSWACLRAACECPDAFGRGRGRHVLIDAEDVDAEGRTPGWRNAGESRGRVLRQEGPPPTGALGPVAEALSVALEMPEPGFRGKARQTGGRQTKWRTVSGDRARAGPETRGPGAAPPVSSCWCSRCRRSPGPSTYRTPRPSRPCR
ncbi:hypothetical protein ACFQ9Z_16385 [Streptomyces sp. NPDC056580]|uniref:hypothetical protein n=1 Tax=Streptomyces sp. NPDC056580 TaxID=3345872 RepID=UPI00367A33EA